MIKRGDSYYGLLQAFADALKLLLKEYVAPTQSNIILFFLGPVITLIFALLGYSVIPYSDHGSAVCLIFVKDIFWLACEFMWWGFLLLYLSWDTNLCVKLLVLTHSEEMSILFHTHSSLFINKLTLRLLVLLFTLRSIYLRIIKGIAILKLSISRFLLSLFPSLYLSRMFHSASSKLAKSSHGMGLPSRTVSNSNNKSVRVRSSQMSDQEFNEWFTGFTDAEGNFYIAISKNVSIFRFSIKLHIDDVPALEFILERLNCGKIYTRSDQKSAVFEVTKIDDIKNKLIPFFENFPLNGSKYLDYLAFKKAFEIKLDQSILTEKKLELIVALKEEMNTKRVNFTMPFNHTIRITPYYLLGLIEGEGSFSISNLKTMAITFTLSLTATQAPLMEGIKNYLITHFIDSAAFKSLDNLSAIDEIVFLYSRGKRGEGDKPQLEITVKQIKFLVTKFIPMFSGLCFVTKKHKDFQDWAFIANLIYTGKHTTEAGRELIFKMSRGMNNYRLSTFEHKDPEVVIDKSLIDFVLNMEDIYIVGSDGLRYKASDGALVNGQLFYILAWGSDGQSLMFNNSESCAKYFEVSSATVNLRINRGLPITRKGVHSKKIEYILHRKSV